MNELGLRWPRASKGKNDEEDSPNDWNTDEVSVHSQNSSHSKSDPNQIIIFDNDQNSHKTSKIKLKDDYKNQYTDYQNRYVEQKIDNIPSNLDPNFHQYTYSTHSHCIPTNEQQNIPYPLPTIGTNGSNNMDHPQRNTSNLNSILSNIDHSHYSANESSQRNYPPTVSNSQLPPSPYAINQRQMYSHEYQGGNIYRRHSVAQQGNSNSSNDVIATNSDYSQPYSSSSQTKVYHSSNSISKIRPSHSPHLNHSYSIASLSYSLPQYPQANSSHGNNHYDSRQEYIQISYDYYHFLHEEIDRLKSECESYQNQLKKSGFYIDQQNTMEIEGDNLYGNNYSNRNVPVMNYQRHVYPSQVSMNTNQKSPSIQYTHSSHSSHSVNYPNNTNVNPTHSPQHEISNQENIIEIGNNGNNYSKNLFS